MISAVVGAILSRKNGGEPSPLPQPGEILRSELDIPQNAPQRADFEGLASVDRHRRSDFLPRHDVMTATDSHHGEPLGFEKAHHLRSRGPRQLRHERDLPIPRPTGEVHSAG